MKIQKRKGSAGDGTKTVSKTLGLFAVAALVAALIATFIAPRASAAFERVGFGSSTTLSGCKTDTKFYDGERDNIKLEVCFEVDTDPATSYEIKITSKAIKNRDQTESLRMELYNEKRDRQTSWPSAGEFHAVRGTEWTKVEDTGFHWTSLKHYDQELTVKLFRKKEFEQRGEAIATVQFKDEEIINDPGLHSPIG